MHVDEALKKLGLKGRWQLLYFCGLCFGCLFPGAWHIVSIVWIGFKPPHHCKLPQNASSLEDWVPRGESGQLSSCTMYSNLSTPNFTTSCSHGWVFNYSISGATIATKWDMVCERDYLVDTAQSMMTFGVLLGSLIFTKLSDAVGRKPVLVFSQLSLSTLGALTVLPRQLSIYYALRFLMGMFQQGVILCNLVMLCEMFSSKDRALIAIGGSALWGLGNAFLPLIAYLVKNWVIFQLIISFYGFIFIPFFWWLPETVPWLYANNELEKAEHTLLRAARMNNITFTRPILVPYNKVVQPASKEFLQTEAPGVQVSNKVDSVRLSIKQMFHKGAKADNKKTSTAQYSVLDLFKSSMLLKHTIICLLFGMVDNLVYFGLIFSSNSMSGNHYFNGFLNAIIEVPACILTYVAVNRFGRKRPIAVTHVLSGLSLLACIVVNNVVACESTRSTYIAVFNTIGKFGITGAFAIVFFYVAELFPTNLRNQAVGICVFFARLGSIMASYATFVVERYPDLLPGLFGSLSILVAVLVAFLPETHNKALPDTIAEMEVWYSEASAKTITSREVSNEDVSDSQHSKTLQQLKL